MALYLLMLSSEARFLDPEGFQKSGRFHVWTETDSQGQVHELYATTTMLYTCRSIQISLLQKFSWSAWNINFWLQSCLCGRFKDGKSKRVAPVKAMVIREPVSMSKLHPQSGSPSNLARGASIGEISAKLKLGQQTSFTGVPKWLCEWHWLLVFVTSVLTMANWLCDWIFPHNSSAQALMDVALSGWCLFVMIIAILSSRKKVGHSLLNTFACL